MKAQLGSAGVAIVQRLRPRRLNHSASSAPKNSIRVKIPPARRRDIILLGSVFLLGLGFSFEFGMLRSADRANGPDNAAAHSQLILDAPTDNAIYPSPQDVKDWASIILARPLFDPRRSAIQKAEPAPSLPRLAGTMISPEGKMAIVCRSASHCVVVKEGDSLGGWKIVSIAADEVQLNSPNGIEKLQIRYDIDPLSNITTPLTIIADNFAAFSGLNLWPSQLKVPAP